MFQLCETGHDGPGAILGNFEVQTDALKARDLLVAKKEYPAGKLKVNEVIPQTFDSWLESEINGNRYVCKYDPNYGDTKLCECTHHYYRHFDGYEDMANVGCKYCQCRTFVPQEDL